MTTRDNIDCFLRLDEVLHTTGLGRNTVYRRTNIYPMHSTQSRPL